jgi:hypothetical protein
MLATLVAIALQAPPSQLPTARPDAPSQAVATVPAVKPSCECCAPLNLRKSRASRATPPVMAGSKE